MRNRTPGDDAMGEKLKEYDAQEHVQEESRRAGTITGFYRGRKNLSDLGM